MTESAAHHAQLERLVDLLLEHETVDGAEVHRVAGVPTPGESGGQTLGATAGSSSFAGR